MKRRLWLSALLVWLPLGLHAEPFTYESPAELSTALDSNGDGLADLVVVDKATGVRRLAYQQPDGAISWAEPRATGLDGVTALTAGRFAMLFSEGSPHPIALSEGFAVAAPGWNRVHVVPNPGDAETYFSALAPGVGPNLVVALDLAGDPELDDLAIATCWEDPPGNSRLYASAWNGVTTSNLYELVEGQSGPLTHGNRARLSSSGPWLLGLMRPSGATSEFLTRLPGSAHYDVGPAVADLPLDATWVWGEFDASGYSQFLFYAPAESTLYLRPVEELTPGVFTFGSGTAFDLGEPIQQVCVLPQTTGALLLIVFDGGLTAGIYDFDGTNAPVLRQTLTAPPGNLYSLAGSLDDSNLLLLHGPAGGAGASTGWERWALDGLQHTLTGSGSLPTFTPAGGRANVFVYNNDPGRFPDAELQLMFQAGDWSVEADTTHRVLDVTAETFIDPTSGLGSPTVTGFSRRPPGFYVPGLNEIAATVNQRSASASVACLSPALGIPMGEIAFNPPSGVYPPTAGGGLTVRIHATPDGPIHFRTDPSQPWTLYSAANPPSLSANTTLWAYADQRTGFWYYDYADFTWHYADTDQYTPIRSATYRIAAVPALEPAPQTDADGDGLGDAWAAAFGISDPLADADGDGVDNRAEFAAATDPLDPASVPTATVTYTVTFLPGVHGSLAGGTPAVTLTVNEGAAAPVAPAVTPATGWLFSGWSPPLPATISADVETTAQYTHTPQHQTDQNGDWIIQLSPELTRLIQFYNSSGYHCEAGTEDGYGPEFGDTPCAPHQADQNGDWVIQLSPELTRLIQFYNLGGYHVAAGTEDGYAPGLVAGKGGFETGTLMSVRDVGAAPDRADGMAEVSVTLSCSAAMAPTSLAVLETLPAGWRFRSVVSRPAPEIAPAAGASGSLGFAWVKMPATWPVTLTYRVSVPAGMIDAEGFSGSARFRGAGAEQAVLTAAAPSAGVVADGRGWFDLSGTYAVTVAGSALTLGLVHDTRGKLTGTATLQVGSGKAVVPVTMPIRGSIRGAGGVLVAALAMQGDDVAGSLRVALALDLSLDSVALQLVGRSAGSIARDGTTIRISQPVALDLPAAMDGIWTLRFEAARGERQATPPALLLLSNGVAHHLASAGSATGPTVLLTPAGLPPDPASAGLQIRAAVEVLADGRLHPVLLSGRGYGQTLGR